MVCGASSPSRYSRQSELSKGRCIGSLAKANIKAANAIFRAKVRRSRGSNRFVPWRVSPAHLIEIVHCRNYIGKTSCLRVGGTNVETPIPIHEPIPREKKLCQPINLPCRRHGLLDPHLPRQRLEITVAHLHLDGKRTDPGFFQRLSHVRRQFRAARSSARSSISVQIRMASPWRKYG